LPSLRLFENQPDPVPTRSLIESAPSPSFGGEFTQGLSAGVRQLGTDIRAAGAGGLSLFGFEQDAMELMAVAQEREEETARRFPRTIRGVEDIESAGDFIRWAARTLGEQAPILASLVLGGGGGALFGRLVGRGLVSRGAAMSLSARFPAIGTGVGLFSTATTLETGATGSELFGATGEINPEIALAAGVIKGSLEIAVPAFIGSRFGLTPDITGTLLRRIIGRFESVVPTRAGTAVGIGTVEAVTESLQEVVDVVARGFVDENFELLSDETRSRILNAAASGALVGAVLGGAVGRRGISNPDEVPPPETPVDLGSLPAGVYLGGQRVPFELGVQTPTQVFQSTDAPGQQPIGPGPPTDVEDIDLPSTFRPAVQVQGPGLVVEGGARRSIDPATGESITINEFQPPGRAQFRLAAVEDVTQAVVTTIDPRSVNPDQISAAIDDLPETISADTPGVRLLNPQSAERALDLVNRALAMREKEAEGRPQLGGFPSRSQSLYDTALLNGFRFEPRPGQGFVTIGVPAQQVTDIAAASEPAIDTDRQLVVSSDTILPTAQGDTVLVTPILPGLEGSIARPRAGTLEGRDTTPVFLLGIHFDALNRMGLFTRENLDADLATLKMFVAEGADRSLLVRELNAIRRLVRESEDTLERKPEIAGLVAAGLRRIPAVRANATHLVVKGKFSRSDLEEIPRLPQSTRRRSNLVNQDRSRLVASLEVLQEQGLIDINTRKLYDVNLHKPGTAVIVGLPTQSVGRRARDARQVLDFYNSMLKKFHFAEEKILVFFDGLGAVPDAQAFNLGETAGGHYVPYTGEMKVIGLESSQAEAQFLTSAIHEFGHFLVHTRFSKTDSGLQQKLLSAYNRALIRGNFGDLEDFRNSFLSIGRDLDLSLLEADVPVADQLEFGRADYFLSFDEWMAEQVAKFFERQIVVLDPVQGFFQKVSRQLRTLMMKGKRAFNLGAEPEIGEWLRSLANNPRPLSSTSLEIGHMRGEAENAEVLGQWSNGEFIPPPQASTHAPAQMMKSLGFPANKVREIRSFTDKFNWFMDLFYNLQQIAQRNTHLKSLNRYVEFVDQWYNFQMRWISRANDRVRAWIGIGNVQQKALAGFIFDIDQMAYLSKAERDDNVSRQPTDAELAEFAKKHGLEPVSLELFGNIKEDFLAVLDQIEETSVRDIQRTISDPAIQEARIAAVRKDMENLRKKPYFPHSRFGDIALIVKDAKGKTLYMEQFANARAAKAAVGSVRREFPDASIRIDQMPKDVQGFRGLPATLLTSIRTKLQLTEEQGRWLDDLIVEMSPSASFRRRMQRRANIPGFSMDAMRSYASYFFSGAKHLARVEFKPVMDEEIGDFGKEIAGLAAQGETIDVRKRRRIQSYMANHLEHIMNPKPDWAQLRSVAFQWYLGFNPSSAALNLTQPVLVGWPYLAARFGDAKAMKAMMAATKDIQGMYKYDKKAQKTPLALFKAIDRAVREGVVDESQATELAATAQGQHIQRLLPGSKSQRFAMQWAHYSAWLFQQSERLNRRIMFRAGWDLAIKNPEATYLRELEEQNEIETRVLWREGFTTDQARAYLAARDAVRRTQFQYAPHARPKFMRGKKGVIFAFFMFQQSMIHFTLHSPGNIRFLAMMMFMAGLMGLPGGEDLTALAKFAARNLLGKEFDVEREVREFVTNLTDDPEFADILLFGAGRAGFGLPAVMDAVGLPKANFDFSRRIGMGRIIPGLQELGPAGLSFDERMARATTDAAGAAYGIGINMLRAMQDDALPIDDFKRWERAMPTSVRNLSRAVRFLREERERTRTGATLIDFDISDPDHLAEIALTGLGFQPTRLTRGWNAALMRKEVESYWGTRRGILLRIFDHSFVTNDRSLRRQAIEDIRQYNATVPFTIMRLTVGDLRRSRKERMRARRLFEAGVSRTKTLRPIGAEVNRLFPEASPEREIEVEDASRLR